MDAAREARKSKATHQAAVHESAGHQEEACPSFAEQGAACAEKATSQNFS